MKSDKSHGDYLLGNTDAEHERLIRQAGRLAPVTERFFREAGIGSGQRVLELGSGVGDVAMLVARKRLSVMRVRSAVRGLAQAKQVFITSTLCRPISLSIRRTHRLMQGLVATF